MEIVKSIGTLVGFLLIMSGIIAIYDARKLSTKWFSFSDKNQAAKWLKVGGFVIDIMGILLLFFLNKN